MFSILLMQQFIVFKLFCMFTTSYVFLENILRGNFFTPMPVPYSIDYYFDP